MTHPGSSRSGTVRRLGYVPALDGVRGIAIAAVTAYHFFGLPAGFFGVDLFFVLSGFLITTLLLEDGRLKNFYQRRLSRLVPGLIAVLFVCHVLGLAWTQTVEGGLYLSNFFRAFSVGNGPSGPVGAFWSLAAEEQFYVVWPLLLLACIRWRRNLMLAVAGLFLALVVYRAALVMAGESLPRVYFGPDTHADGLVLGCLAALVRPGISATVGRIALGVVVTFFAVGAWTTGWLAYGLPAFEFAALLVVLAAADGRLPELSVKPLVVLGLISYSLYLWQQPVAWLLGGHTVLTAAIATVVAWASYRWIETPFRRLGRPPRTPYTEPSQATG